MSKLVGRRAWVVGGGSGIGAAAATALAADGAEVVLSGRRLDALQAIRGRIETNGGSASCLPLNVACQDPFDAAVSSLGDVDILVYTSGSNTPRRSWAELSPADWSDVVEVNLTGAFRAAHAVLPAMRRRGAGTILIVSSWAGWRVEPIAGAAYTSSKHALLALTETINIEEGKNGVRATCLCPAEVDTEILSTRPNPPTKVERARMLQAEDVASLVSFVATAPSHVCFNQIVLSPVVNRFYGTAAKP